MCGGLIEETVREHHVEQGAGCRHGKRVAAKRRAVRPDGHALGSIAGREAGAERETSAKRLGKRHDVGDNASTLIGEELPRASHAGLHLVEYKQQPVLVAQPPQRPQQFRRHDAHATFPHDRLYQNGGSLRPDCALGCREISERHLIEAIDHRTKAIEILFLAACREGCERASMESAVEGDDAISLRGAACGLVFARRLDGAFHRFGAGIAEEDHISEACCA